MATPAPRSQRKTSTRAALATGNGRLATSVAARIVDDVARRGWVVGDVIGSEAEMLERYECSRAVLREAIRLLEHQNVARMRRGPGGGLVVTEPDVSALIDAAVIYLLRCGARLDEVFEARLVIEDLVMAVTPDRVDEDSIKAIRTLVDEEDVGPHDPRTLHVLLATASGNHALELFVELLSRLATFYFSQRDEIPAATFGASDRAHRKIAEAVVAGDAGTARRRMATHLQAEADFIRNRRGTRQELNPHRAIRAWEGSKRGQATARLIFSRIIDESLLPGTMLGSEADLMQRYDVSRAGLREAIRILEHHNIAVMRRGHYGGLFVVPADISAVTDVVALHFERNGIDASSLAEARIGLELALVDRVIDRWTAGSEGRLHDALLAERGASADHSGEVVHDLHAVIAGLAGNQVLELLARILIRLSRAQASRGSGRTTKAERAAIYEAHVGIVEALVDGDRDVARLRLRRHLTLGAG